MTIFQARQIALHRLQQANPKSEEAHLCARLLLDEIAGISHAHLVRAEGVLSSSQTARFENFLVELEKGRPLSYVLGKRDWFQLTFRCDERALIPRPETEFLVEAALLKLKTQNSKLKTQKVADLGTGSGCIAVSLAKSLPDAEIYATDISPEALSLARENARFAKVESRLHFVLGAVGDWAGPLREYSGFDLIVSNPPYIAHEEIENLQPEIRDYEPHLALDGGQDGMDCYRQIATQCGVLLKSDGALICELGAQQFPDVRAIFENQNWRVENPILDFAGIERILIAELNQ